MSDSTEYIPPKVWTWEKASGGTYSNINRRIAGADHTIADMAIRPWYGGLVKGWPYNAAEFLSVQNYKNVERWADRIVARPAVARARKVNRTSGIPSGQLHERHDASDLDTRTQDKLIREQA